MKVRLSHIDGSLNQYATSFDKALKAEGVTITREELEDLKDNKTIEKATLDIDGSKDYLLFYRLRNGVFHAYYLSAIRDKVVLPIDHFKIIEKVARTLGAEKFTVDSGIAGIVKFCLSDGFKIVHVHLEKTLS